ALVARLGAVGTSALSDEPLLGDLPEGDREAGDHAVEAANEACKGAGYHAGELPVQDLPRGQAGDRLEAGLVDDKVTQEAALEGQDLVFTREGRDRFRRLSDVATHESEGGGAGQDFVEALLAHLGRGQLGQSVL